MTATTVRADAGEVRDDDREEVEKPFRERYDEALHNPRLAKNVTRYQQNWRTSRTSAMHEVEFIDLREELRAAKTDAIDRIDEYLDQFKTMAERAGAKVHFAVRRGRGQPDRARNLRRTRHHPDRQIEIDGQRGGRTQSPSRSGRNRGVETDSANGSCKKPGSGPATSSAPRSTWDGRTSANC